MGPPALLSGKTEGPGEAVLVCGSGEWGLCRSLAGVAKDAECEALPKASVNVGHVCGWGRKMA